MPKAKADRVVTHRIELQEKERELLEHLVYIEGTSKAFNNIAEPAVKLMNDVTGMITFLSILAAIGVTGVSFVFVASEDVSVATVIDLFVSERRQAIIEQGLDTAAAPFESLPGPLGDIAEQYGLFGVIRRWFFPD